MAQLIAADHGGGSPGAGASRPAFAGGAGSAFAAVLAPDVGTSRPEVEPETRDHAGDDDPGGSSSAVAPAAPQDGRGPGWRGSGNGQGGAGPGAAAIAGGDGPRPPAPGIVSADPSPEGTGTRPGAPPPAGVDTASAPVRGRADGTAPDGDGRSGSSPLAALPIQGKTTPAVAPRLSGPASDFPRDPAPPAPARDAVTADTGTRPRSGAAAGQPPPLLPSPARRLVTGGLMARAAVTAGRPLAMENGAEGAVAANPLHAGGAAPPPAAMPAAAPPLPPSAIIAQITQAVSTATGATIEITLEPRELGPLRLVLHPAEGAREIMVSVGAERQETMDLLRRHAGMLEGALRDLGFARARLEFTALPAGGSPDEGAGAGHAGGGDGHEGRTGRRGVPPGRDTLPATPETSSSSAPPVAGTERLDMRV